MKCSIKYENILNNYFDERTGKVKIKSKYSIWTVYLRYGIQYIIMAAVFVDPNAMPPLMRSFGSVEDGDVSCSLHDGFPYDLVDGASTVFFLLVTTLPMLEKLDRIKIKLAELMRRQKIR